jgi:anti-sigma factor RsiW
MKTCERFTELLSDFAENNLASEKKHELEAHLSQCAKCHSAAERIVSLRRNLHQMSPLHTSQDFETILRTRIKLDRRVTPMPFLGVQHGGSIRIAAYSTAVILLLAGAGYLWQIQTSKSLASSPLAPTQIIAPNSTTPSVASAKILYTLDKVTPQLWPNLGAARKGSNLATSSAPTDSARASAMRRPEATPVSHQTVTF